MLLPFHYSFLVTDLDSTRKFYVDILGCREGRSSRTWVDFDFYGSQLSAHVTDQMPTPRNCGEVDGISVPMPHFGCVLLWDDFHRLAERIQAANLSFIIAPRIRFEGKKGEQATMFLLDFSGNALEFKSFKNSQDLFAS